MNDPGYHNCYFKRRILKELIFYKGNICQFKGSFFKKINRLCFSKDRYLKMFYLIIGSFENIVYL